MSQNFYLSVVECHEIGDSVIGNSTTPQRKKIVAMARRLRTQFAEQVRKRIAKVLKDSPKSIVPSAQLDQRRQKFQSIVFSNYYKPKKLVRSSIWDKI